MVHTHAGKNVGGAERRTKSNPDREQGGGGEETSPQKRGEKRCTLARTGVPETVRRIEEAQHTLHSDTEEERAHTYAYVYV